LATPLILSVIREEAFLSPLVGYLGVPNDIPLYSGNYCSHAERHFSHFGLPSHWLLLDMWVPSPFGRNG